MVFEEASDVRFYQFRSALHTDGRVESVMGLLEAGEMSSILSIRELETEFGGYIKFYNRSHDRTYLSVWGSRKVSRLRRLLRERGLSIAIVNRLPVSISSVTSQRIRNGVRTSSVITLD
jgi:hypothetical protein